MIELVILDIDGIITDGMVIIDSEGNEQKRICLKDIDAIFELCNRGYRIAAITGEDTEMADYFEKRFPWEYFYRGNKEKIESMRQIEQDTGISRNKICYMGDGKYDIKPLMYAGLGVCPADSIDEVKNVADIVLQNNGGHGCIWELASILEEYKIEEAYHPYVLQRLNEHLSIFKKLVLDHKLIEQCTKIGDLLVHVFQQGGALYLCGNGGSSADAQHIAAEFVGRFYKERSALNAEALTVNTSILTAIGNDYGFEHIFTRQLQAKAKEGDMLIGLSTSAASKNVLEALCYAKKHGIHTILMAGEHSKQDLNMVIPEYEILIPSVVTPRIQEAHIFVGHVIAEYVEDKMFGKDLL